MLRKQPSVLSKKAVAKAAVGSLKREASISLKRQLTPMVKSLVAKQLETKYISEGFSLNVSAESTTAGVSGHAIRYLAMPAAGTGSGGRVGNKINIESVIVKGSFTLAPVNNINIGLDGVIYLVAYADGGNFQPDDFLDIDPTSGTYFTTRSMRRMEKLTEFRVLAQKRISSDPDPYQSNTAEVRDFTISATKLNLPCNFSSGATTPLQNQLAMVYVASGGTQIAGATANYIQFLVSTRVYYKDA